MKNIQIPSLKKLIFVAEEMGAEKGTVDKIGNAMAYIINALNKNVPEEYGSYLYDEPSPKVAKAFEKYNIEHSDFKQIMREYCKAMDNARTNFRGGYEVEEWVAKLNCVDKICALFPDEIIFKYYVKTVDKDD